jgi:transcriptional regulator with XRE-family HTH domain
VKSKRKRSYYKDDEVLKSIGTKIRELRINKEISQETLANGCDLDYSQVNRMELGKVNFSISNLFRIARALNVDPKELL